MLLPESCLWFLDLGLIVCLLQAHTSEFGISIRHRQLELLTNNTSFTIVEFLRSFESLEGFHHKSVF